MPTSVSSTSVSGRKSRCWSGVAIVAPALGGRPGLLDPEARLGQRRPVHALHRDRTEPVVAARKVKCRRRRRRQELVPESHRIGLDHRAGPRRPCGGALANAHHRGPAWVLGLVTQDERLTPAAHAQAVAAGVEQGQVAADLDQKPLVARGHQPPARVQSHHGQISPLGPALG